MKLFDDENLQRKWEAFVRDNPRFAAEITQVEMRNWDGKLRAYEVAAPREHPAWAGILMHAAVQMHSTWCVTLTREGYVVETSRGRPRVYPTAVGVLHQALTTEDVT